MTAILCCCLTSSSYVPCCLHTFISLGERCSLNQEKKSSPTIFSPLSRLIPVLLPDDPATLVALLAPFVCVFHTTLRQGRRGNIALITTPPVLLRCLEESFLPLQRKIHAQSPMIAVQVSDHNGPFAVAAHPWRESANAPTMGVSFTPKRKNLHTSTTKFNSTDSKGSRKQARHSTLRNLKKHPSIRNSGGSTPKRRNTVFFTFPSQQTIKLVPFFLPCASMPLPTRPLDFSCVSSDLNLLHTAQIEGTYSFVLSLFQGSQSLSLVVFPTFTTLTALCAAPCACSASQHLGRSLDQWHGSIRQYNKMWETTDGEPPLVNEDAEHALFFSSQCQLISSFTGHSIREVCCKLGLNLQVADLHRLVFVHRDELSQVQVFVSFCFFFIFFFIFLIF